MTAVTKFLTTIPFGLCEKLSSACSARPLCGTCGLDKGCQTPYLKPYVPPGWTKKILGVGEAPGEDEDSTGRPFTGPSGKLLYRMLREAGFKDRDLALVNAVRCRPRRNATPSMRQLRACRPFLLRVVEQLRPGVVVCFGGSAAKAVLDRGSASVTELRGRGLELRFVPQPRPTSDPGVVGEVLHDLPGLRVVDTDSDASQSLDALRELVIPFRVTFHPAAVLRGATHLQKYIVDDLKRIRKTPRRELEIAVPTGKVISIDTEFDPHGNLLTVALADSTRAYAWDAGEVEQFLEPGGTGTK